MQRVFGHGRGACHTRHQIVQLCIDTVQLAREFAHLGKAEHRHGFIGLYLAQTLHDAAQAAAARAFAGKDRHAHVARGIDAKVAGDDGSIFKHRCHGEAFGDEPVLQRLGDLRVLWRTGHQPQQNRGDPLRVQARAPILREDIKLCRIKGALAELIQKHGIGHELGMLLPLQRVFSHRAEIMGRVLGG